MKKKFTLLMASMMLLGASGAQAWTDSGCCYEDPCCEDQTGFYLGAFGGGNFISTTRRCSQPRQRYDVGYVVSGSLGYRYCHNTRFEFEYAYRNNKRRGDYSGAATTGSYGSRRNHRQNAYMFNGFYDMDLDVCSCYNIKPFVGVGIGYVSARGAQEGIYSGTGSSSTSKDRFNGFAWQLIAGVAYPICDEVDLSLEYRFFKGKQRRLYNNDVGVGLKYYF